jgi:hypothetical protein
MMHYTTYSHALFLKTSETFLEHARTHKEGQFYYCLGSIVFCAFAIEAFVNHCGISKEGQDWERLVKTNKRHPTFDEKLSHLNVRKDIFEEDLKKIRNIRNFVAHGKPETIHKNILDGSDFHSLMETEFEKSITLENTENAFTFSKKFMKHVNYQSGCNFSDVEIFHTFAEAGGSYG